MIKAIWEWLTTPYETTPLKSIIAYGVAFLVVDLLVHLP